MAIKLIKKDDTKPFVKAVLMEKTDEAPSGEPVNLTGATVKFVMRKSGASTPKVDAAAEIVDAANGVVQYKWSAEDGDTDTVADYLAEFKVTDSEGYICTWWDLRTAQEIEDDADPEVLIIRVVD